MPKTETDHDQRAELAALGLNPDAPALDHLPERAERKVKSKQPVLAPEGVDPHAMPVSDIEFDPALLDEFPSLSGAAFGEASRRVFALYKSHGRNKDRNRRLHDEIGLFITRVRRDRETGTKPVKGKVKEKVKATGKQRDLAARMAEKGLDLGDLSDEQIETIAAVLAASKEEA